MPTIDRRGLLALGPAAALAAQVRPAPVLAQTGRMLSPKPRPHLAHAAPLSALPDLPAGFWRTFQSRFVQTPSLRLHVVTGGSGPPVLLAGGWPQSWFAWRHVMADLAKSYTVIAVDARGVGLTDKPEHGYDFANLGADLANLMTELGHDRFALVAHDVGNWSSYALASDHPDRVARLAVTDATIPGVSPSPPLLGPDAVNTRLWHFAFNRAGPVAVQMVQGREEVYFGHQFASKAGRPDVFKPEVLKVYIDALKSSPEALRASFSVYEALEQSMVQIAERKGRKLQMPVLAIAGEKGTGPKMGADMNVVASDVTSLIIPGSGHFVPEEAPDQMITALRSFLKDYQG